MNNGLFWRGDRNGLIGGQFSFTIPEIPITLSGGGILELPITGQITGLSVDPIRLHGIGSSETPIPITGQLTVLGSTADATISFHFPGGVGTISIPIPSVPVAIEVNVQEVLSAITTPRISIQTITFNNVVLGGPSTPLTVMIGGNAGPVNVDFYL
ncbi:hypothetical protein, partial [Mycobacterium bourgelatii]